MKIDYKSIQDNSEIECVRRFLTSYNLHNKSNYKNPVKNLQQNEIDVFCYDDTSKKYLEIQVKKADPVIVGDLGKSRSIYIKKRPMIFRDNEQAIERVLNNIHIVELKYRRQYKDMSDVVLLLDEIMDPPDFVMNTTRSRIATSTFKQIWITTRTGCTYLLFD